MGLTLIKPDTRFDFVAYMRTAGMISAVMFAMYYGRKEVTSRS